MKLKKIRRGKLSYRLTATLVLSVSLLCQLNTYAAPDFSIIQISQSNTTSTKLINPLYLDTSKTTKPSLKIKTSVPYSGEFSESDYFSSTIDDSEPETPISKQEKGFSNKKQNAPPEEIINAFENKNLESVFTPPQEEEKEEICAEEKLTKPPENNINNNENTYCAGVDLSGEEIDLEGSLISKIHIAGLETLKPQTILSTIKNKEGSIFNAELLQQDLQRIYATGFFTDNMAIEPMLNQDGSIDLTFIVKENIQVANVSIEGNTVISTSELMPFVKDMIGLPQNINLINNSIEKINDYYHNQGYILAQVNSVDDDANGNLILGVTEGIINKISIEGNEKTKDYVIERNIMTQSGVVYNENYLKEDLARIYSSQIFSDVDRIIEPSKVADDKYDVKVVVKEQSSNSIALGGGIDNALGAFGSVSLKEDNFLGRGQRVSLSGILGSGILLSDSSIKERLNYQLELSFFEPYFLNADNSLASKLYYRDLGSYQIPLAIERRIGFSTVVEHKVRGHKNLSTTLGLGLEDINLKEGDFSKISALFAENNLDIANRSKQLTDGFFLNLSPGVKYSTIDSDENPRNGYIAQAKFIESFGLSEFNNTSGRLAGGVTKYYPVREKSSFALTARAGAKIHGDDMPEVMAFRLGGPYSIRGFRMNGVGTGDAFLMGSAELATPLPFVDRFNFDILKRMRLTFFVDAGHIFDPTISSTLYDRPLSAITAGVGLKMYIPGLGAVSVDYGLPLTNTGRYGSDNGYFTFGTGGMSGYGW